MRSYRFYQQEKALYHSSPGFISEYWQLKSDRERWLLLSRALKVLRGQYSDFVVHALVLMSTHFHLLFSCASHKENFIIEDLHSELKKMLNETTVDDVLDRPLVPEQINSYQQLLNAYRYIYRNPVNAGLSHEVEAYPFSTLRELLGKQPNLISSSDLLHVIQDPIRVLNWLNDQNNSLFFH